MFCDFRFGHLGYWVSLLAIAIMGVALHLMSTQVQVSSSSQENRTAMLRLLTAFGEAVSRAESAHRGWLISRAPELHAERDRALDAARGALERIRALPGRDGAELADVAELRVLLQRRQDVMRQGEASTRFGQPPLAARIATASAAHEVMARLATKRDTLRAALQAQVDAERQAQRAIAVRSDRVLVFAGGLMLLVLLPAYLLFLREAAARTRTEGLLRDVTENLPAAVFRLRRHPSQHIGRFEFLTSNVGTVRGVPRETLLRGAHSLEGNLHPDDVALVHEALASARGGSEGVKTRFRVIEPDGGVRWLESHALARREPDGSVLWHGYWQDITEERVLEEALVQAKERAERMSRAKSAFLAAMSHEIRTPMTGVLATLEMVALGPLQDDQREAIALARESGEAMLRIIGDILDFSKMEAGKLELRPEPVSLARTVRGVAGLYDAMARQKGLELTCSVDPALGEAYVVDAVRLTQILSNLASNALKFTDAGRIELTASLETRAGEGDVVRFSVRDTGRGIRAEDRARLFTPFEQASGASGCGTGLGLSISRGLAGLMGGSLGLESEPGKGTLATLLLTLERAAAPARAPAESRAIVRRAPRGAAGAKAPRILVVDDHPINRLVLDRQVTMLGYPTETAGGAQEALERICAGAFGAILADVNMPHVDGYALARLVRERERREGLPRIVIVACTANAFRGDMERCLEAGMDDYLVKPVTLSQLEATLTRWLPSPANLAESHA